MDALMDGLSEDDGRDAAGAGLKAIRSPVPGSPGLPRDPRGCDPPHAERAAPVEASMSDVARRRQECQGYRDDEANAAECHPFSAGARAQHEGSDCEDDGDSEDGIPGWEL